MDPGEVEEPVYEPKDAIGKSVTGAAICGSAGFFAASARVALARENIGSWSVFTRMGGMIGLLGLSILLNPIQFLN